jgi:phosphoribosylamine--glycine ligase
MKILVVGGGGREHALTWKLAGDGAKPEIFCAPGNAGTASLATNVDIKAENVSGLVEWARANRPDLTVVGPEAPLCEGLIDALSREGLRGFGPTGNAARLEGSKIFAKEVMQAACVPTAEGRTFTDPEKAIAYVREKGCPIVVKADGLAAGKGVTVCSQISEAEEAIRASLVDKTFGSAGSTVLVEEALEGEEASILALVDGEHVVMLASSQDHKRVFDDDKGPNTGGMGAYSPAPIVTDDLWPVIRSGVFEPTLAELKKRGIKYQGILYAGLMISPDGRSRVLEFNCRFGDPETQAVLARLDSDLVAILEACVDGSLSDDIVRWRAEPAVCVVMASGGYPGTYEKGKGISGLGAAGSLADTVVFHAGTKLSAGSVVTSGGRVLGVTALGANLPAAIKHAYEAVSKIGFDGAHYRTDIGAKALR